MALGGGVAGVARVIVEGDTRRLKRDLSQAETSVNRFARSGTSAIGGFARAYAGLGAVAGAAGLAMVFRSSVEAASNLEEQVAATTQVFQNNGREMIKWAGTTAHSFNLSRREALTYGNAVGNMLRTVGVTGTELDRMSQRIVQLGADMASFNNQDPSEMLERLRSGLAGEAEPLRRFGVLLSEARVTQEAVNMGLVAQGEKLTEQEKVLARYNIIMRDTALQQGDVARTSGSVANQQRELRMNVEELQASLGQKLLPIVAELLEHMNEWAEELRTNEELQQNIRDAIEGVTDVVTTSVEVIQEIVDVMGGWEEASQFIIAGTLVTKLGVLRRAFTGLAGAEAAAGVAGGTGIAGAAGQATRLNSVLQKLSRGVLIPIAFQFLVPKEIRGINLDQPGWKVALELLRRGYNAAGDDLRMDKGRGGAAGPVAPPGGFIPGTRPRNQPGGGLQLPTSVRVTHQTAGLSGYPAADIFAKPGTPVRAPENGAITRIQGSATTSGGTYGFGIYYDGYETGNGYFIKHVINPRRPGNYSRGDVIAQVSPWSGGSPHVHLGINRGGGGPTSRGGSVRPTPTVAAPSRLESLEEQRARAELTKTTRDDLVVLRKIESELERRIKAERDIRKRTALLRDLRSVREDILDITTPAKKRTRARRRAGGTEDVPTGLQTLLEEAEGTSKNLEDDLRALDRIIKLLEGKLARAKRGSERYLRILRQLNQFRSQRRGVEAEIEERAGKGATGIPGVEDVIERRPGGGGRPAGLFQPGENFQERIQTEEGRKELGKILASLEPRKQEIRAWANELKTKRDAAVARKKALQAALTKAQNVKPKSLRSPTVIGRLKAQIKVLDEQIKQLDEAMDEAFAMWADLESEETSEVQRLAGEDEERRSSPPERGGGDTGGSADFGADTTAADTLSAEEQQRLFEQNLVGFLTGRRDLTRGFSSNILAAGFAQQLGDQALIPMGAGGNTINVQNFFAAPPGDPHAWTKAQEFELKALTS